MKVNFRNICFILLMFVTVVFIVACSDNNQGETNNGNGDQEKTATLSGAFETGSSGGAYNVLGGGMLKVIHDHTDNINLNATTPASVNQVPLALNDNQAVLGLGMVDMMRRSEEGVGEFDTPLDNLAQMIGLYDNIMSLIVLEKSDITAIDEIEGLKIGVASESTKEATIAFVESTGIDASTIRWEYLPYAEMTEAIKDNNIDAAVYTGFPRNGLLEELANSHGIRFLTIDEESRAAFDEEYPLWASSVIPAGTYPGVDEDAYGQSYFTVLYTNKDVPEEHIYNITKAIIENNDEITEAHPAGQYITLEKSKEYIENGVIEIDSLHPGAKKYLEEEGVLD